MKLSQLSVLVFKQLDPSRAAALYYLHFTHAVVLFAPQTTLRTAVRIRLAPHRTKTNLGFQSVPPGTRMHF